MRLAISFGLLLVISGAQAQTLEYQFNEQSILELTEMPNGTVAGQVLVPGISGVGQHAEWSVSGQRNPGGYDLDFFRTDSDLPSISGTFGTIDAAGRPVIEPVPGDGGG